MKFRSSSPFKVGFTIGGDHHYRQFHKINHAIAFANKMYDQQTGGLGIMVDGVGSTFMAYGCSGPIALWVRLLTVRNILMREELLKCQQTSASSSTTKPPTVKT